MRRLFVSASLLALASCASTPVAAPPATPPAAEAPAPQDSESFRAKMPEPAKPPDLVLPTFEQAQLDNGLTVLVATRRQLPLVSVGIAFSAGSAQDPAGAAGTADIAYKMLLEGAGGKDTITLDNAFGDLGVSPSVGVTPDGAFLGVQVLTGNVQPALALLADVVRKPTFAPKDFERRKKQQLADIVRRLGSPGFLAQQAYLKAVFGEGHPYAHPTVGTPAEVSQLTLPTVQGFYRKHVGPKATALVVAGDLSKDQAVELAKKYFGDWKGTAVLPPAPPAPSVPPREQVRYVSKPGLEQTTVMVGRPGLAAGHPDEEALELATTVFGGFFGSRLNMNLREAKGYTYGAGASSDARLGVGPLTAQSAVRANVTGPAVTEFFRELADLRSRPITSQELESAREGLIRSFPGNFERVSGLGASAASLFYKRLPMDEFTRTVERLEKATPAEVQRVAEAYLDPAAMQLILVGDPDLIQTQVGPLHLGTLTKVDVAGAAGK
ncbi:pitrilysin family protein [Stigmatella sp. ncwal1]|uniref:Pitrilysin family protein n=1 Tax=Stigmatella ashevillensis TaxID=2995309 RepID=A0ABT5DDW9_9BACT|nr:pitrilysin family protein [Stigmatella ashevillena]MDC0711880.1 pitrilysin family protein [Stigmatella ashevillena]